MFPFLGKDEAATSCTLLFLALLPFFAPFEKDFDLSSNLISSAIPGSTAIPLFLAFSSFPRALAF